MKKRGIKEKRKKRDLYLLKYKQLINIKQKDHF